MSYIIKALLISLVAGSPLASESSSRSVTSLSGHLSLSSSSKFSSQTQGIQYNTKYHLVEPQKIFQLIKLSPLSKVLSYDQRLLFSNYLVRAVKTKKVSFDGILNLCQEKGIQIPSISTGLLTLLKEIHQVVPQVTLDLDGYYKYIIGQPKIHKMIIALGPIIQQKAIINEDEILKAFCLYLDFKAKAEAKGGFQIRSILQSIIELLNIESNENLLDRLAYYFGQIESRIIQIVPEMVITKTIYIPALPTVTITDFEIQELRQYKLDLNLLLGRYQLLDSNIIDNIFDELNTKYSRCNACISSSYSLKKETLIFASAGFNSQKIQQQVDISVEAIAESNLKISKSASSSSTINSSNNSHKSSSESKIEFSAGSKVRDIKEEDNRNNYKKFEKTRTSGTGKLELKEDDILQQQEKANSIKQKAEVDKQVQDKEAKLRQENGALIIKQQQQKEEDKKIGQNNEAKEILQEDATKIHQEEEVSLPKKQQENIIEPKITQDENERPQMEGTTNLRQQQQKGEGVVRIQQEDDTRQQQKEEADKLQQQYDTKQEQQHDSNEMLQQQEDIKQQQHNNTERLQEQESIRHQQQGEAERLQQQDIARQKQQQREEEEVERVNKELAKTNYINPYSESSLNNLQPSGDDDVQLEGKENLKDPKLKFDQQSAQDKINQQSKNSDLPMSQGINQQKFREAAGRDSSLLEQKKEEKYQQGERERMDWTQKKLMEQSGGKATFDS